MADDSDSPLSSPLSSPPSSEDEALQIKMKDIPLKLKSKSKGLDKYFKPTPKGQPREPTPEPPKRAPSPTHEYTFADNDGIAFLIMFRARFNDAFPKSLPHYGPQDIERGISSEFPDSDAERLLCALLGLVLNRKKDVERGHHGKALEEAVLGNRNQWPAVWHGVNPLNGGKSFNNMSPEERLTLLRTLALWSLNTSEAVSAMFKEAYKQTRRDDDKNQPKAVQPWFTDTWRRKYWLIEGLEDTHFRVYRENDGKTSKTNTWFSVAGSIDDINALAQKFEEDGTSLGKINATRARGAVPRFEAGEEKRRRKEYRIQRKKQFEKPEPGWGLYEGRTRGKRMRYTYDDEAGGDSDGYSSRRSMRDGSGYATPAEAGPTITASGRQVKSRLGGVYGESMLVDQRKEHDDLMALNAENGTESEDMPTTSGRPLRKAVKHRREITKRAQTNDESDNQSGDAQSSGDQWSGNEDEADEADDSEPDFADGLDEDDEMSADDVEPDEAEDDNTQESLVVQLRYRKGKDTKERSPLTAVMPNSEQRPILGDAALENAAPKQTMPYINGFVGNGIGKAGHDGVVSTRVEHGFENSPGPVMLPHHEALQPMET